MRPTVYLLSLIRAELRGSQGESKREWRWWWWWWMFGVYGCAMHSLHFTRYIMYNRLVCHIEYTVLILWIMLCIIVAISQLLFSVHEVERYRCTSRYTWLQFLSLQAWLFLCRSIGVGLNSLFKLIDTRSSDFASTFTSPAYILTLIRARTTSCCYNSFSGSRASLLCWAQAGSFSSSSRAHCIRKSRALKSISIDVIMCWELLMYNTIRAAVSW